MIIKPRSVYANTGLPGWEAQFVGIGKFAEEWEKHFHWNRNLGKLNCRNVHVDVIAGTSSLTFVKDRSVTPLRIIHFIQSNSTAWSNSMNYNSPSIWITIKFQIVCCAIHSGKPGSKLIKEISHGVIVFVTSQEIFFSKFLTKLRE